MCGTLSLFIHCAVSPAVISMLAGENWKLEIVMSFGTIFPVGATTSVVGIVWMVGVVVWPHPAIHISDVAQIRSAIFFMGVYNKD